MGVDGTANISESSYGVTDSLLICSILYFLGFYIVSYWGRGCNEDNIGTRAV